MEKIIAKEITKLENNIHIASYDYYKGIKKAKELGLKQTSNFEDVLNNTHFLVCCGNVMLRIK